MRHTPGTACVLKPGVRDSRAAATPSNILASRASMPFDTAKPPSPSVPFRRAEAGRVDLVPQGDHVSLPVLCDDEGTRVLE